MKLVIVFVVTFSTAMVVEAFMGPSSSIRAGQSTFSTSMSFSLNYQKALHNEVSSIDYDAIEELERLIQQDGSEKALKVAEAQHGMPWKASIDSKAFQGEELLYMPFWEWHINFLRENLTDLKVIPCTNNENVDFHYKENKDKKARIVNLCLSSREYRKIRLTYYDAGDNTQVFNAVLYPDPKFNLPILGIDLLAFNRKKYLAIVDFQPLHQDESEHDFEFSHILAPIKDTYQNLKGRMSSKFYDETQFFSDQMLFSRFEDESIVLNELFPAFQQYVQTHLALIRQCGNGSADPKHVLERQRAYDIYSAERDPATGLFTAMFGHDWAMSFVHDFLFSMSEKPALTIQDSDPVACHMGTGNPSYVKTNNAIPLSSNDGRINPYAPVKNNHVYTPATITAT